MITQEMAKRLGEHQEQRNRGERFTYCYHCGCEFSPENVFTLAGARETQISGMCEVCFDDLFEEE